jgi:hypothetical protein
LKDPKGGKKDMARDKTNIYDYYKAWDKYAADVDKDSSDSDGGDKEIDGFIPAGKVKA